MTYAKRFDNVQAIVLAAGRSARFKTKKSKLLFNICGRTMVLYPLKELELQQIPATVVLGHQAEEIRLEIEKAKIPNISYAIQHEQKGTADAVSSSRTFWTKDHILILSGDTPLITEEILSHLIASHLATNAIISFCTTMVIDPTGYGRVIEEQNSYQIVEERDCTEEQKSINRINAGIYVISRKFLEENINQISPSPVTKELYLTDLIKIASDQNLLVNSFAVPYDNVRGVNTLQELWSIEQIKRSEFIKHWMSEGVRFELAQSIHIDINVKIAPGSFIGTGVHLLGNTIIGEECFVGAFSIIEDSTIGDNTNIHSHSVIQHSTIGKNVHAGPFARLRNNVILGDNVHVGNFVEMKTVTMGENSKTKHLTYLGDTVIGKSVNIGAGTITCNYDGVTRHKTIIEDNVFIGSNNTLIAPLNIKKGSYTAGGSTITEDVPENTLAIGRSKQQLKEGYAKKLRDQLTECKTSEEDKKKQFNFHGAVKTEAESNNPL